jgi:hypothetical protein
MRLQYQQFLRKGIAGLILWPATAALAVSCTTQSQMTPTDLNPLVQASKTLMSQIQASDVAGVKASTVGSVAGQFDSIATEIQNTSPLTQGATITVSNIYLLDASDLKSVEDTQFFCGAGNTHEVVITIPQLPAGRYALATLHASGVKQPRQVTFILQQDQAQHWGLAGLYARALTSGGHDGLWYWTEGRSYAKNKQNWNAYFYLQTAGDLLVPVTFLTSPNLDKLIREQNAVAPEGLPGAQPMKLTANGQTFNLTNLHTDGSLGGLDLVISYDAQNTSDPVETRTRNVELMKALLSQHPELREAFHGLWVYANAPQQRPFANELPMNQIQ